MGDETVRESHEFFAASVPSRAGIPRRWLAAVATVAVVVLGGCASWRAIAGDDGAGVHGSAGSCAAVLVLAGRTYVGYGDPRRVPRPGPEVGTATIPACSDTNAQPTDPARHVAAFQLPGVSRKTGVLADGTVWVRKGVTPLPGRVRALYAPVRCTSTKRFTVSGTLTGINAMPEHDGGYVRTPYTATMWVDDGPPSLLDGYSRVTVRMRVTSATKGGRDARLLDAALSGGTRVSVRLRCADERFAAVSLERAR